MERNYQKEIEELLKSSRIFVFMKGEPENPACRFSAQVTELLKKHEAVFGWLNVLEDDGMRQAIKQYSDWPTIPQVYVDGRFIGGADILAELEENDELKAIFS